MIAGGPEFVNSSSILPKLLEGIQLRLGAKDGYLRTFGIVRYCFLCGYLGEIGTVTWVHTCSEREIFKFDSILYSFSVILVKDVLIQSFQNSFSTHESYMILMNPGNRPSDESSDETERSHFFRWRNVLGYSQ